MNLTQIITRDKAWSGWLVARGARRYTHHFFWFIARTGDSWLWAFIILLLLWQWRELGLALLWAVGGAALIVAVSKGIFKRKRPSNPRMAFSTDKYSFPSGHAARVNAIAVTLTFFLPGLWPIWFVWATAVSIARVVLARHYLSDVIAGWLVGVTYAIILNLIL
jgi:membrane-associated phospholipid phosphatase